MMKLQAKRYNSAWASTLRPMAIIGANDNNEPRERFKLAENSRDARKTGSSWFLIPY